MAAKLAELPLPDNARLPFVQCSAYEYATPIGRSATMLSGQRAQRG
jgi:hypothetical protein